VVESVRVFFADGDFERIGMILRSSMPTPRNFREEE